MILLVNKNVKNPDAAVSFHTALPGNYGDLHVGYYNGDGYSNIEESINGTDPQGPKVDWNDPKNNVDPRNKPA